ncbi:peptidylprolyl isomerase [Aestuariibaculum sediminum]|uniref:Peptidyl-prolyl cis-trans isomerase n=1 Tax=Aestuariibaculum sediminum TaxID=2770637 RepID=A0A8J6Q0K9_9FLAO|nr:peptidyl-prolyl cis-trans isomerase [Aestuariibaculum sediminum]MBD0833273.1 peptidyl-prolyl cis-trans isomerase [Aestuariibaculum sediminum]
MRYIYPSIVLLLLVTSCHFFKEVDDQVPVARVNDSYLYYEDIEELVSDGTSKEDSILLVQNYINQWATQQLLIDGARLNLNEATQNNFNKLVNQYKNDLYSKAYLEALVAREIDSVITKQEAERYYELNKGAFKLNEELIKFRYIHLDEDMNNYKSVVERFKRFNNNDKRVLDSLSIQFKSYSLNDSIWIKANQVVNKIAVINSENKDELLKKSNFVQLKDSLGVYLMQVNDVLLPKETAPLEYVKPTINQIVINKRKLELIKKLEKDITKDAIKNKQFEIYK